MALLNSTESDSKGTWGLSSLHSICCFTLLCTVAVVRILRPWTTGMSVGLDTAQAGTTRTATVRESRQNPAQGRVFSSQTQVYSLGAWREGSRDGHAHTEPRSPRLSLPSAHASLGASPTHLCLTLLTKTMKPRCTLHTVKN